MTVQESFSTIWTVEAEDEEEAVRKAERNAHEYNYAMGKKHIGRPLASKVTPAPKNPPLGQATPTWVWTPE